MSSVTGFMQTVLSGCVSASVCHRSVSHSPASAWWNPDCRQDSQWLEQWTPRPDHPEKDQWHHSQKQRDLSDQPSGERTQVISTGTSLRGHCRCFFPTGRDTHTVNETFQKAFPTFLNCCSQVLDSCYLGLGSNSKIFFSRLESFLMKF